MDKRLVVILMMLVLGSSVVPAAGLGQTKDDEKTQLQLIMHESCVGSRGNETWPMYRHDSGNTGCSPYNAPFTNHLAWKKQINSEIYAATPILYADKLFLSTNWFYKGPLKMTNPLTRSPPSVSELLQRLWEQQNDTTTGLYCLDAKTGQQLWSRSMAAPNDPAIVDGKLYITDIDYYSYMSSLYCLNATTGNVIWQKSVGDLVLSPTVVADQKIFLGCLDLYGYSGSVLCYDLSGNLLWNKPLSPYEMIWFSAPAYSGGYVYFLTSNWYSYFYGKLYCLNAATGQALWSHSVFSYGGYGYQSPSAVCRNAKVYVTDFDLNSYEGSLKCYDGVTGSSIWTCYLGSVLSFSSPAVGNDSVYVTASDLYTDTNWMYRIQSPNGSYLWRIPLPTTSYPGFESVTCSADKVMLTSGISYGSTNQLFCYDRLSGAMAWHFATNSYILGQSSIGDNYVYVADESGNIYAFEDAIKIQNISGGFLMVSAQIQNIGGTDLTNITWSISVTGGYLGLVQRERSGTIQDLPTSDSKTVRLPLLFGFGPVEIVVKATLPSMNAIKKETQGILLGPLCIIPK
jgi:outer membrane protein assembly factor BamB